MAEQPRAFPVILNSLERYYGPPKRPEVTDPFELILLENIGYLCDDAKRTAAFLSLKEKVGTTAAAILAASDDVLVELCALGGILAQSRGRKLRRIAEMASKCDMKEMIALPLKEACKQLSRFPGIGEPSAEKILLFCGAHTVFAIDSNGLRTLLRIGYGEEKKNYRASYRSVQEALNHELPKECEDLIRAHLLLREHGQKLCKRAKPQCDGCPLLSRCDYGCAHKKMN